MEKLHESTKKLLTSKSNKLEKVQKDNVENLKALLTKYNNNGYLIKDVIKALGQNINITELLKIDLKLK